MRDTSSSADGKRLMFDISNSKGHIKNGFSNALTIATLGMAGTADINHEEVRVLDTVTGGSCFSWSRGFPSTLFPVKSAAISPSGKFVAIVNGNTLEVYRVPESCGAPAGTGN